MDEIRLENLHYGYDGSLALKNISYSIKKGSVVSVIGPNGSGKSTLLKNINYIYTPFSGSIYVKDKEISKYSNKDLSKIISYVPQNTIIDYDFSVYDIVLMGRYPYKKIFEREGKKDIKIVEEALIKTNTYYLKDKSVKNISGGERQRVLIAKALAQNSDLIILDEPTSQLDINHEIEILKLIKEINKKSNKTIIMAIHDIDLASRFSDEIILLNKGEIYASGKVEDVLIKENIENVYGADIEIDRNKYLNYLELTVF